MQLLHLSLREAAVAHPPPWCEKDFDEIEQIFSFEREKTLEWPVT